MNDSMTDYDRAIEILGPHSEEVLDGYLKMNPPGYSIGEISDLVKEVRRNLDLKVLFSETLMGLLPVRIVMLLAFCGLFCEIARIFQPHDAASYRLVYSMCCLLAVLAMSILGLWVKSFRQKLELLEIWEEELGDFLAMSEILARHLRIGKRRNRYKGKVAAKTIIEDRLVSLSRAIVKIEFSTPGDGMHWPKRKHVLDSAIRMLARAAAQAGFSNGDLRSYFDSAQEWWLDQTSQGKILLTNDYSI